MNRSARALSGLCVLAALLARSAECEAQALRESTRGWWATLGVGPSINLRNDYGIDSGYASLHLNETVGVHFDGRGEGAALALDLHQAFTSRDYGLVSWNAFFEAGPRFYFDIAVARRIGLYVAPNAGFNFALLHARGVVAGFVGTSTYYGFAPQIAVDLRLVVSDRLLVFFRPAGVDVPVIFDRNNKAVVAVNYDLQFGAGLTF